MDFDGFFRFGKIGRSKRILCNIWKKERARLPLIAADAILDGQKPIHIDDYLSVKTKSYQAYLNKCFDMGDGTSWFEFHLLFGGQCIFRNTNWRHDRHYFRSSQEVLNHVKAFEKEYLVQVGVDQITKI